VTHEFVGSRLHSLTRGVIIMPVVVAPYVARGALCRTVSMSTFHAALVANASALAMDVSLRARGGASFARLSDDATPCGDDDANADSYANATMDDDGMHRGFTLVATMSSVRGAMEVRVVREDVDGSFARDVALGSMPTTSDDGSMRDDGSFTFRIAVPSRTTTTTTTTTINSHGASPSALESSSSFVESIVFLETSGIEDAFARVTSMSIERDVDDERNGNTTTTTTTTTGIIDDEVMTFDANDTTSGADETSADAMTLAAEALAQALAAQQSAANANVPPISATIDGGDTFALLWVLLAALVGVVLCGVGFAYARVRQRAAMQRAAEARTKKSDADADARNAKTKKKNDDNDDVGVASRAETRVTTNAAPRAHANALGSYHYRGALPPLFAHMNSLSLSRRSSAERQARVERLDSLGIVAAALVDGTDDAMVNARGDDAVTLDVNRTVDSEENHRVALDIDSSRSFADDADALDADEGRDVDDTFGFACGQGERESKVAMTASEIANEIAELKNSLIADEGDDEDDVEDAFAMISSQEFDRYVQVFEKLGSGSSSSVFSATWHAQQVALKCFTDAADDASNVQKEIDIMRSINHPSIVKIYAACTSPLCLLLELVHGGSLHEVLHCSYAGRSVALAEKAAVKIARDIADAMAYLHELKPHKIIHRDLKPHNVLIEKDSFRAVLADFGVSRAVRTSLKTERIGAGTVNYMAPCLFTDGKATEKVDVYSFAMILYETCTGIIPWKGKHPMAVASLVTSGKRPALSSTFNVSDDIVALIKECWHGDPAARPTFRAITSRLDAHACISGRL